VFGFCATNFFASVLLGTWRGGWPRPVKIILDQYAFTCAGDLPVNCT
jgi:hypothetical protein